MIDLQLSLSRQFEMCSNLMEKVKDHKNHENKMEHYSRKLHYCNILLNAQVAEPAIQSVGTSIQAPVSQYVQLVESLYNQN